jgi:hypothetical protein
VREGNYNALATSYDREHGFYEAARVRAWCEQRGKALHVKKSTPLANDAFVGLPGCVPVDATQPHELVSPELKGRHHA